MSHTPSNTLFQVFCSHFGQCKDFLCIFILKFTDLWLPLRFLNLPMALFCSTELLSERRLRESGSFTSWEKLIHPTFQVVGPKWNWYYKLTYLIQTWKGLPKKSNKVSNVSCCDSFDVLCCWKNWWESAKTSLDSVENCKSKLLYDWQFYDFENTEVVVPVWDLGSILSIILIHSNPAETK